MADSQSTPKRDDAATVDVAASSGMTGVLNHERYEVKSLLGEGAFGAVYRSWDHQLHREVAIKIPKLRPKFQPEQFLREARSAARLRHPGLVAIYDAGYDRDGRPFAVFELIQGTSLLELAASGRLDVPTVVRLVAEAAEAMSYTHTQQIVHRDLKPSNILIDHDGRARVSDFGLALDDDALRDHAGDVAGSPAYMSPEQVRGEANRLDGRTDIWSLGVILFELLAGRRPFQGRDRSEYFDEIVNREPKPIRQINPSIPRALDDAVLKCLAKPVRERYATAGDFAADLRAWLAHGTGSGFGGERITTPVVVAPSSPTVATIDPQVTTSREKARPAIKTVEKKQSLAWVVAGAALALSLVLGVFFFTDWMSRRSVVEKDDNTPPAAPKPDEGTRDGRDHVPDHILPNRQITSANPLLASMPAVLAWPIVAGNSRWRLDPTSQELTISCASFGALKLAESKSDDFDFSVDLAQTPWTGGVGILWGGRETTIPDSTSRRYDFAAVELRPVYQLKNDLRLALSIITIDDSSRLTRRNTIHVVAVDPSQYTDSRLEIRIRHGALNQISFGGQSFDEMCLPSSQEMVRNERISGTGGIGVFVEASTAMFRNATWQPIEETNP